MRKILLELVLIPPSKFYQWKSFVKVNPKRNKFSKSSGEIYLFLKQNVWIVEIYHFDKTIFELEINCNKKKKIRFSFH